MVRAVLAAATKRLARFAWSHSPTAWINLGRTESAVCGLVSSTVIMLGVWQHLDLSVWAPWMSAAFAGAATAAALARVFRRHGPVHSNDSYQYLSAARNLASGSGFATDLIHFDTERRHGRAPAPVTTWPPGYPALLAALLRMGVPEQWAATGLSVFPFAAVLALLPAWGIVFQCGTAEILWAGVLVGLSSTWLSLASWVAADALFTALASAGLLCLAAWASCAAQGSSSDLGLLFAGQVLLGMASLVRYAGYFFVLGTSLFLMLRSAAEPGMDRLPEAASLLAPALLIAPLVIRNLHLSGTWLGGNTKRSLRPWPEVLAGTARAVANTFSGVSLPLRPGLWILPGACIALLLAAFFARGTVRLWQAGFDVASPLLLLALNVSVYLLGVMLATARTPVTDTSRYLAPLIPLLAVLAAALAAEGGGRQPAGSWLYPLALWSSAVIYTVWNLRDAAAWRPEEPHAVIQPRLLKPCADGHCPAQWIKDHVPEGQPILGACGQATGHLIRRPVVSLLERHFGDVEWDEHNVRECMQRFGARVLVLYPGLTPKLAPEQEEFPFLADLLKGGVPQWLAVRCANGEALILEQTSA